MIESFLSSHFERREKRQLPSAIKVKLDKCNETDSSDNLLSLLNDLMAETAHLPDEFIAYVTSNDSNWKFWKNLSSMMLFPTYVSSCLLKVVSETFD